jgi:hypothetical protein
VTTSRVNGPITVAIVDDYDVVVMGLANMFDQYSDRVVVAELDSNEALVDTVDIALYDSFAQPESDHEEIGCKPVGIRWRRTRFASATTACGHWSPKRSCDARKPRSTTTAASKARGSSPR